MRHVLMVFKQIFHIFVLVHDVVRWWYGNELVPNLMEKEKNLFLILQIDSVLLIFSWFLKVCTCVLNALFKMFFIGGPEFFSFKGEKL